MNFETWWNEIGFDWVRGRGDLLLLEAKELAHKVWEDAYAAGHKSVIPPLDLATAQQAIEDYRAGKCKTIDEILNEL